METAFNQKTLHCLDNKMSEQQSIEVIDLTEIESSQENIETVHDEENVVIEIEWFMNYTSKFRTKMITITKTH